MRDLNYAFKRETGKLLNSGQSKSVLLTGNIHDLFYLSSTGENGSYVPLIDFLTAQWQHPNRIVIVYELNGPVRFMEEEHDNIKMRKAWDAYGMHRTPHGMSGSFDDLLNEAIGKPSFALEFLRQLCFLSRSQKEERFLLRENLVVIIEGIDFLIPQEEIARLQETDRHRIAICHDWFSDPGFMNGNDVAVLIGESRSLIHNRIARLPQLLEAEILAPDEEARSHFLEWFTLTRRENPIKFDCTSEDLIRFTGGLSIHAFRQLLVGAAYESRALTLKDVVEKVRAFIESQLGEDTVEFKRPTHTLNDAVGFKKLKDFIRDHLIPRIKAFGQSALPGAAVCGPIGGGKTYIFEAMAAELDMVVLVLKNIRSQWFGQTDIIIERFRRVVRALPKVLICVDEADTQFGGVGPETHETERRLTGKIQAMMSEQELRGKVTWLLMTARIHRLSPDIRRPGRVGDLIIPVLDPEGEDREEFLKWVIKPVYQGSLEPPQKDKLLEAMKGYSAASYATLRSELVAVVSQTASPTLGIDEIVATAHDILQPAIQATRRYQTLQALMNCTRRRLLPNPDVTEEERAEWHKELKKLEAEGIT